MNDPVIFVSPDAPVGEQYGLVIGAWDDPEQIVLDGFATMWDAWAFAVCNGMNDPADFMANKRFTLRPPEEAKQLPML